MVGRRPCAWSACTAHAWVGATSLACVLTYAHAAAQAAPGATSNAASSPREAPAASNASPGTSNHDRVLFLLPAAMPASEREALGEALMAQFSLGKAELLLALDADSAGPLGDRIAAAEARAAEVHAIAVFWIDPQPGGPWLVHVLDPAGHRLLVRPLDAPEEHASAAIEAVAVMARDSTDALLTGALPAATPTAPAPPPPPAPPPRAPEAPRPPQRHVRLSLGYAGQDFAEDVSWRHGAALGASWLSTVGLFVGSTYTFTEGARVETPIAFEVERPLVLLLFGGYRHPISAVALDAALGITVDVLQRHTPRQAAATASKDSARLGASFSPRFRIEWAIAPPLGLYAGGGIDVLFNHFTYVSEGAAETDLLRPLPVRGVAEAGIAYYP